LHVNVATLSWLLLLEKDTVPSVGSLYAPVHTFPPAAHVAAVPGVGQAALAFDAAHVKVVSPEIVKPLLHANVATLAWLLLSEKVTVPSVGLLYAPVHAFAVQVTVENAPLAWHVASPVPVYPVTHVTVTGVPPKSPVMELAVDLSELATSVVAQVTAVHVNVAVGQAALFPPSTHVNV